MRSSILWLAAFALPIIATTLIDHEDVCPISEYPLATESGKTLLVEIHSSTKQCSSVKFDDLLADLTAVSTYIDDPCLIIILLKFSFKTATDLADIVVILSGVCSDTYYPKYSLRNSKPMETAVVKFSSNEEYLHSNTTSMFEEMFGKVQNHFDKGVHIE